MLCGRTWSFSITDLQLGSHTEHSVKCSKNIMLYGARQTLALSSETSYEGFSGCALRPHLAPIWEQRRQLPGRFSERTCLT